VTDIRLLDESLDIILQNYHPEDNMPGFTASTVGKCMCIRQEAQLSLTNRLLYFVLYAAMIILILPHQSPEGSAVHTVLPALRTYVTPFDALGVFVARRQCVWQHLLWRRGCLCLCVSVTLMFCAKTTWSIIVRPFPDCSPAILVFPWQILTR